MASILEEFDKIWLKMRCRETARTLRTLIENWGIAIKTWHDSCMKQMDSEHLAKISQHLCRKLLQSVELK